MLTAAPGAVPASAAWWSDSTLYIALALAGFTVAFGTASGHDRAPRGHGRGDRGRVDDQACRLPRRRRLRHLGAVRRCRRPVRARAPLPRSRRLLRLQQSDTPSAYSQWAALTMLAMLSVIFLPRQFQMLVVENVDERHLNAPPGPLPGLPAGVNVFVLPIALGGLLRFGVGRADPETFVLAAARCRHRPTLRCWPSSAACRRQPAWSSSGAIAISTMVCNDLVMPWLLRLPASAPRRASDLTGLLLGIRRGVIVALLLLGYVYFRVAGEAYALVSIGLISFAAVAQFAPALLAGMYWKGGSRHALAGLAAGFGLGLHADAAVDRQVGLAAGRLPARGTVRDLDAQARAAVRPGGLRCADPLSVLGACSSTLGCTWPCRCGARRRRARRARAAFVDVFERHAAGGAEPCSGAAARWSPTCFALAGRFGATPRSACSRTTHVAPASLASIRSFRTRSSCSSSRRQLTQRHRQRVGARDGRPRSSRRSSSRSTT